METRKELFDDVLIGISERIERIEDYAAFGSVCSAWRRAAQKESFKGLCLLQQTPYLMHAAREDGDDRQFYSLLEKKVVATVSLPEARGRKCIGSLGWLLTIGEGRQMSLLHPFSRTEIELPHQTTFPDFNWVESSPSQFIKKMVLSSRPCETSDFVVMVIYGFHQDLGFWRPKDEVWTQIDNWKFFNNDNWLGAYERKPSYKDAIYCNSQFLAIDYSGNLWACDIAGPNPTTAKFITQIPCNEDELYIVELFGKLLIVAWHWMKYSVSKANNTRICCRAHGFDLYEIDLADGTWVQIKNLGEKALFIGHSASLSVKASNARGIKANHIYYAGNERLLGSKEVFIYNLEDEKVEFLDKNSTDPMSPAVWFAPFF